MVRELPAGQSAGAAAALLELRPHFGSVEALVAQVEAQRASGYRLIGSFEDGERDAAAAAAAGFFIDESLAWGRFLYVHDLVTREALRGRGHADALLSWLETEARSQGCDQLHLDSGVGPERADAHRFYFRHRMRITSYHFARELGGRLPRRSRSVPSMSPSEKPQVEVPAGEPPPTELQVEDLSVGDGDEAASGQNVEVHYVGVSWASGRQFDASWDRGDTFRFGLGHGQVIPGWDQGVAGMKVGGRRRITIPPELAYGSAGAGGVIGPDETLVFVVDLVAVR